MADQVADLFEAGIPHDVVLARAQTEAFMEAAGASAGAAATSRADAAREASDAAASAALAKKHADQRIDAITVDEEAPIDQNRWDGKVWIETSGGEAVLLNVWDASDPGHALSPAADLSPSDGLSPADAGAWHGYTFATSS